MNQTRLLVNNPRAVDESGARAIIRQHGRIYDTSLATSADCLSRLHQPCNTLDDNDILYLNNTVHFRLFDTAVNGWLLTVVFDPHQGKTIFLVVETGCSYFAELAYPQADVGLRVARQPFIRYL